MRKEINLLDLIITEVEYGFEVLLNDTKTPKNQSTSKNDQKLNKKEIEESIRNIRVNHVGEVCAQALYRGQAYFTSDKKTKKKLYLMCKEEFRHLQLFNLRLKELKGKQSIFNNPCLELLCVYTQFGLKKLSNAINLSSQNQL